VEASLLDPIKKAFGFFEPYQQLAAAKKLKEAG
jgi:hypothetical protein